MMSIGIARFVCLRRVAWTAALLLAPGMLPAQGTDASITGAVRARDGAALPGATITVRNEATGFVIQRLAGDDGHFSLPQLPLGGPYTITADHLGYQTAQRTGIELSLGDRVALDLQLNVEAVALDGVEVVAQQASARLDRFGASTPISGREIERIPATGRNFTDLAALSPLAGDNLSIAGDKRVSTAIEVDGVSARNNILGGVAGLAPYVLSLEAIREFEVATNVYDVTKGRQGGGSVSAVTKSGTNDWHGSFFSYHRNDNLAGADYTGRDPSEFSVYQWGGSLGGPLVKDRAHFFVAFDRQDESTPYRILDVQSDADAIANDIHPDSITRLTSILENQYGLSSAQQVGGFTRKPISTTGFGRIDWQLAPSHRLTVRGNFVDFSNDAAEGNDATLFEAWADNNSFTVSTLASLTSALGRNVHNELKFSFTRSTTTRDPLTAAPKGIVTIRSELPNGNTTTKNVTFGGNNGGFNESTWQNNYQLVNTTHIDWRNHQIKFGIDQLYTDISLTQYLSRWGGEFRFNSLADLESLRPSQFGRKVPLPFGEEPNADVNVWNGAVFAQTEWEPAPRLRAMVGLRYDVASFMSAPNYNPAVEQLLGLRTDHTPTDWTQIQPRARLTWDLRGDGRQLIRLGAGRYAAQTLYVNQANHQLNPGDRAYTAVLTGDDVPIPDFPQYRADPSTSPVPDPQLGAPEVNVVSPDFAMPTAWKANISYQHRFGDRLSLGANFLVSRTSKNYHYFDRNLVDEPYFRIEGGRGVFVPADLIATDGTMDPSSDATKTPELGRVRELIAIGEARQEAFVLEAGIVLPREGSLDFSYTWNRSRDNSSYNCCAPNTATNTAVADDPRDLDGAWGYSDFDFRHKLVGYGSLPKVWGFQLSGRYIARSGTPVSLVVNGNPNGDFTSGNDLAFVFDPDDPATPPDIAASMRKVLDNSENLLRDYIRENLGGIAERNGGRAPWRHNLDVRLTREFQIRPGQRTELIVDVFNFANLLDDDRGGYRNLANKQSLLFIEGFDPETQRFIYSVNENIGVVEQKSGAGYQIQVGLRHSF
ncbi:MAG: carboxypeptidase regulatory-like domain-containing protein [Gemmatimonas sp.]|nr:carboxypeptidase regulatory-like domain-containing protein [Gemmatimonas sp.]